MRILVTGGTGVVGTPLVALLTERGHEVWTADLSHSRLPNYVRCDVGHYREVEQALDRAGDVDLVYHLAGEFGRYNGEHYYERMWRTNAVGTKNMLTAQAHRGFRMVFTSTSEVYGDYDGVMTEDVPSTVSLRLLNDYAMSKWVNEMQIRNASELHGSENVCVRLFNTYGPGEHYSPYRSVVCRFVYCALRNLPYEVHIGYERSFCWLDDAVRTMANIADRFRPGEVYNIASDQLYTIRELSDIILAALGKDDHLITYIEGEQPHTTRIKRSDASKAREHLDHQTTVSLPEGVERTIAWDREVHGRGD